MRRLLPVLAFLILLSPALNAQRASVGASYTLLSLTYPDQIPSGFGGWLAWDFGNAAGVVVGLDVGANLFPEDHPLIGRQTQLLAGIRGGVRTSRVGAFGRLRPGLVHFSERFFAPDIACVLIFPPPESCLIDATNPALDVGGTLEVYPAPRAVVRIDAGDTLIRFRRGALDPAWKHNLQFSAGAGLRF